MKYYPENRFSSYEEYVQYLKEKGLALEALEGMYGKWTSIRGNLKEDSKGNIVGGLKL